MNEQRKELVKGLLDDLAKPVRSRRLDLSDFFPSLIAAVITWFLCCCVAAFFVWITLGSGSKGNALAAVAYVLIAIVVLFINFTTKEPNRT